MIDNLENQNENLQKVLKDQQCYQTNMKSKIMGYEFQIALLKKVQGEQNKITASKTAKAQANDIDQEEKILMQEIIENLENQNQNLQNVLHDQQNQLNSMKSKNVALEFQIGLLKKVQAEKKAVPAISDQDFKMMKVKLRDMDQKMKD